MDKTAQLKLQAYLDGELAEGERRDVETWLARDAEATSLLTELRQTSAALAVFESEIKLPESREFYWSKIEREIRRQECPVVERKAGSLFAAWRRFLVPAGAMAVVIAAGLLTLVQMGGQRAAESEMALVDTEAFTYRDFSGGTTLVWLSYPAERESSDLDLYDTFD